MKKDETNSKANKKNSKKKFNWTKYTLFHTKCTWNWLLHSVKEEKKITKTKRICETKWKKNVWKKIIELHVKLSRISNLEEYIVKATHAEEKSIANQL